MNKIKNYTLVFLVDRQNGRICLGQKKMGHGIGKLNGAGGKLEEGETPEEGAAREVKEEFNVHLKELRKMGEITFYFAQNEKLNQFVHIYISEKWENEPSESDEMKPEWFPLSEIPYDKMWVDDKLWLPVILEGKKVEGSFTFGINDEIVDQSLSF